MTFSTPPEDTQKPTPKPDASGPYTLLTINTAPERAFRLIGRVTTSVEDQYTINHIGNIDDLSEVEETVTKLQPNIVFSASMWNPEQVTELQAAARKAKSNVVLHAIPQGLQVERGPDAIVEYLQERIGAVVKAVDEAKQNE